ncbi:MAG: hypothetical protein KKI08_06965 [Armatimonadetes bacterium]|nr:hypothetical protein [Armatimonadota bacterium]
MRLLLLGQRMLEGGVTPGLKVDEAKVVVVCPEANTDHRQVVPSWPLCQRRRDLSTIDEIVRASLRRRDAFSFLSTERAVAAIRDWPGETDVVRQWLEYQSLRYGW